MCFAQFPLRSGSLSCRLEQPGITVAVEQKLETDARRRQPHRYHRVRLRGLGATVQPASIGATDT